MPKIRINHLTSKTHGVPRSGKWPSVRKKFLAGRSCAVCGGTAKLQAHHVVPFHQDPKLELDQSNLIPLCEARSTINCHLIMGHGGDFRDVNPDSRTDAAHLNVLMKNRQMGA